MRLVLALLGLSLSVATGSVGAQVQSLGPQPYVGGVQVGCPGTTTYVMPINDLAQAVPGEIRLSPGFFSQPDVLQIFVYAHECAHQIYGGGAAGEAAADCWAIKLGRDQGWLPPNATQLIAQSVANTAGDWTHAPGPIRIQQMAACYNTP